MENNYLDYDIGFTGVLKKKGGNKKLAINETINILLNDSCIPLIVSVNPKDSLWRESVPLFSSHYEFIGVILFIEYRKTYTT